MSFFKKKKPDEKTETAPEAEVEEAVTAEAPAEEAPAEEAAAIPQVATSLEDALKNLDADREFLTAGGVFSDDFINSYIELKTKDVQRVNVAVHPLEFELYYSV